MRAGGFLGLSPLVLGYYISTNWIPVWEPVWWMPIEFIPVPWIIMIAIFLVYSIYETANPLIRSNVNTGS